SFSVASGQPVGRGSLIANVGCSGYCTGPHLHFEVRVNGSPVDPMPYLQ
ncbi:MAG: M23 family metallopeptidase, partial [Actinobacteria bacterium]|nr:M23 family metallopeptidase [Actinomycetota bacterium]